MKIKGSAGSRQILFVCEDNAGPSQMAEAFAEKFGMKASSAGKHATSVLNPYAIQAMKESGIDISRNKPKSLTPLIINAATLVVAIGCSFEDAFPVCLQTQISEKTILWNWRGLKRRNISAVREIRDEIERRVNGLSRDL